MLIYGDTQFWLLFLHQSFFAEYAVFFLFSLFNEFLHVRHLSCAYRPQTHTRTHTHALSIFAQEHLICTWSVLLSYMSRANCTLLVITIPLLLTHIHVNILEVLSATHLNVLIFLLMITTVEDSVLYICRSISDS